MFVLVLVCFVVVVVVVLSFRFYYSEYEERVITRRKAVEKKIKEQGEATKGERRETEKEEDEEEEEAEKKNGETLSGSDHKNRNSCSSHLHNGSSCTKRPITDSSRPTKATVNVEEATLALQRDITVKDP